MLSLIEKSVHDAKRKKMLKSFIKDIAGEKMGSIPIEPCVDLVKQNDMLNTSMQIKTGLISKEAMPIIVISQKRLPLILSVIMECCLKTMKPCLKNKMAIVQYVGCIKAFLKDVSMLITAIKQKSFVDYFVLDAIAV